MADLTPAEYLTLRAIATGGNDNDLPPADRRTRGTIVEGRALTLNERLDIDDVGPARVLGPARGRRFFLIGWRDATDGLCVQTVPISRIRSNQ